MVGQAPRRPGLLWRKQDLVVSAGLGRDMGVAHLLGRPRAGRRGHVGEIRPMEPEGPQCEP